MFQVNWGYGDSRRMVGGLSPVTSMQPGSSAGQLSSGVSGDELRPVTSLWFTGSLPAYRYAAKSRGRLSGSRFGLPANIGSTVVNMPKLRAR